MEGNYKIVRNVYKYIHIYLHLTYIKNIDRPVGRVANTLIVDFQLYTFKNTYNAQSKSG